MNIEDIKLNRWYKIDVGYFMPTGIISSRFDGIEPTIVGTRIKYIYSNDEMHIVLTERSECFSLEELIEPCDKPIEFVKNIIDKFCDKNGLT
jgi:hypothetical protein